MAACSNLPTDVLIIICEKLISIIDYIRFGAVCRHWRVVLCLCHKRIPPQLPTLFVCNLPNDHSYYKLAHSFFHATDFHTAHVLHSARRICSCSGSVSSHGWLLTPFSNLFNPFLSVNNVIPLPSLDAYVKKAILSDDPALTSNYTIVVICRFLNGPNDTRVAILKPGDISWKILHNNEPHSSPLQDITYYKGKICAVCFSGKVVSWDITTSTKSNMTRLGSVHGTPLPIWLEHMMYKDRVLIESAGDLLCVVIMEDEHQNFRVYKFEETGCEWIKLHTLNGHSLFIDKHSSLSLLASDFVSCKADHIYYASSSAGKITVGAFNLKDGTFERFVSQQLDTMQNADQAIWLQPTLNMTARLMG